MKSISPNPSNKYARIITWFKRFGVAGFIFFLIKGLLWLLIPYLIAKGIF